MDTNPPLQRKITNIQEFTLPVNADKIIDTPYHSLLSVDYNLLLLSNRLGIHSACEFSFELSEKAGHSRAGIEKSANKARMDWILIVQM